jgi:hypothetical protein
MDSNSVHELRHCSRNAESRGNNDFIVIIASNRVLFCGLVCSAISQLYTQFGKITTFLLREENLGDYKKEKPRKMGKIRRNLRKRNYIREKSR